MEKIEMNITNMNLTSLKFEKIARELKAEEEKLISELQKERLQGSIEKLKLSKYIQTMTFENYIAKTKEQQTIKEKAERYAKNFNKQSIILSGKVGSGKTHLSVAILNYLIQKLVDCRYFDYREGITRLKQNIMTNEYNEIMSKLTNCTLLVIDDLFKGAITNSEIKIIFEIINSRYKKGKPVVISSELSMEEIIDIDEAIGSRIYEMSKNNVIKIKSIPNQRLKKTISS